MWLFLRYGSNTLLYFFLNESQKILLYETKERAILIKYRVHVRELWKWKWHRLDVFPRKFHPPFPSHLDGNWLFRSWRARMPSGRKLRRFEGKRVARFTYVASWNSPRPVIIVARSGAKASRGPETMSTGRNNKVEGKVFVELLLLSRERSSCVSRGQRRRRKEVWKGQRRLIYIRIRYRNINIAVGSMLGL